MIEVHVNNVNVSGDVKFDSIRVEMNLDQRWTASFLTKTRSTIGHSVAIFDHSGDRIFGGSIHECQERPLWDIDGSAYFTWFDNACVSWEARTDRRVLSLAGGDRLVYGGLFVVEPSTDVFISDRHGLVNDQPIRFQNTGGGSLPGNIFANTTYYVKNKTTDSFQVALSAGGATVDVTSEGLANLFLWRSREVIAGIATSAGETLTLGTVDNGVFAKFLFDHVTISEAIQQVASLNGWIWYFAPDGTLNAHARTTEAAPFDLSDPSAPPVSVRYMATRQDLQNAQFRRIAHEGTPVETETFSGNGAETKFWLTKVPKTIDSIVVGDASLSVGIDGVDDGKEAYYVPGSLQFRTATAPPVGTDNVVVQYHELGSDIIAAYNNPSIADRAAAEGGSGVWATVVDDAGETDRAHAQQKADADVAQFGGLNGEISYKTARDGLRPGQVQQATLTAFTLNSTMLINSVVASSIRPDVFSYEVKATTAARLRNIVDMLSERTSPTALSLNGSSGGSVTVVPGGGGYYEADSEDNFTPDLANGSNQEVFLDRAVTNIRSAMWSGRSIDAGTSWILILLQDSTGGRLVTFDSEYLIPYQWQIYPAADTQSVFEFVMQPDGKWLTKYFPTTGIPA